MLPPSSLVKELMEQQFRELDEEARRALLARARRSERRPERWRAARARIATAAAALVPRRATRPRARSQAVTSHPTPDCERSAARPPMPPSA